VRTARWKYSARCPDLDENGNPVSRASADTYIDDCLYDLKADPWELTNLVGHTSHAEVVKVMRERLARRMVEVGESVPRFVGAPVTTPYEHVVTPEEARA
jgi:arylsulfatase A-like enzyme